MARSARFPIAVSLGALLLLAPAAQACGSFARMSADCPMSETSRVSPGDEVAAMPAHHTAGHGGHANQAQGSETESVPEVRCHEPGEPSAADCCLTGAELGQVEALVFASPKLPAGFGMPAVSGAGSIPAPARVELRPAWVREPPPLDELPRYARFSSYLL